MAVEKALEILDKMEFFGGQRAGRELWNDKPKEIQDKDIEDFCRDLQVVRSALKDAEQARHGRWIYKYFDSYCSVCGWENKADTVTRIRNDYPYCPHCGAKMDEVQVKNCCNCKFGDLKMNEPPCSECDNNGSKWEGVQ